MPQQNNVTSMSQISLPDAQNFLLKSNVLQLIEDALNIAIDHKLPHPDVFVADYIQCNTQLNYRLNSIQVMPNQQIFIQILFQQKKTTFQFQSEQLFQHFQKPQLPLQILKELIGEDISQQLNVLLKKISLPAPLNFHFYSFLFQILTQLTKSQEKALMIVLNKNSQLSKIPKILSPLISYLQMFKSYQQIPLLVENLPKHLNYVYNEKTQELTFEQQKILVEEIEIKDFKNLQKFKKASTKLSNLQIILNCVKNQQQQLVQLDLQQLKADLVFSQDERLFENFLVNLLTLSQSDLYLKNIDLFGLSTPIVAAKDAKVDKTKLQTVKTQFYSYGKQELLEDIVEALQHLKQLKNHVPKIYLDTNGDYEVLHLKQMQSAYQQTQYEQFIEQLLALQENKNVILFSQPKIVDKKDVKKKTKDEPENVKTIGSKGFQIVLEGCKFFLVQDKAELDEIAVDLFGIISQQRAITE